MTQGNGIPVNTVLLLAFVSILVIGMNSVRSVRWLVKDDQEGIVSRRPLSVRIVNGLLAAVCAIGTVRFVRFLILADLDSASGGWLAVILSTLLLSLITVVFLFISGPCRLSIDLRERRYSFTQGFPLLTWTKHGQVEGGELFLNRVKSGPWQVRFRAPGWKYGLPLEIYMTENDARSLEGRLSEERGLSCCERQNK